jgi:PPP family 3-phenylpropionic acid transporter
MESLSLVNRDTKNHNFALYKLEYFFIYSGDALFSPFFALFFTSAGLTITQSGILLGLVPFFLFLGDFVCGFLSTSYRRNLTIIRVACLLEALWIFLTGAVTSFSWLLIFVSLASFSNGALFQIQDGSSSICCGKEKRSFDSIRIYGSIAYAVALFLDYFFLKDASFETYSAIFKLSSLLFVCAFFTNMAMKSYPDSVFTKEKRTSLHFDVHFFYYVLFYVLVNTSVGIAGYYMPLYLKELGLSDNEYSLFYSIRVVCEISIILPYHKFIYPLLKSHKKCLIIGAALYIVSTFMGVVVPTQYALVSLYSCLRGFGSGFVIVSSVGFLQDSLGDDKITSGLTLVCALTNLFSGIGNLVAPYIYSETSYIVLFGILFGLGLLGYFFLFLIPSSKKQTT